MKEPAPPERGVEGGAEGGGGEAATAATGGGENATQGGGAAENGGGGADGGETSMDTAPTAPTPSPGAWGGVFGAAAGASGSAFGVGEEVTSQPNGAGAFTSGGGSAGGGGVAHRGSLQSTPQRQASAQRIAIEGLTTQLMELHSELAAVKEEMRVVVSDAHEALNAAAQAGEEAADARYLAEADRDAIERLEELERLNADGVSGVDDDSDVSSEVLTRAVHEAKLRRTAAKELSERVKARTGKRGRSSRRRKAQTRTRWYNILLTIVLVLVGLKVLYEVRAVLWLGGRAVSTAAGGRGGVPRFDFGGEVGSAGATSSAASWRQQQQQQQLQQQQQQQQQRWVWGTPPARRADDEAGDL